MIHSFAPQSDHRARRRARAFNRATACRITKAGTRKPGINESGITSIATLVGLVNPETIPEVIVKVPSALATSRRPSQWKVANPRVVA